MAEGQLPPAEAQTRILPHLLGNGIIGTGMSGSGKSATWPCLLEQFGQHAVPFAVFDLQDDYSTLVQGTAGASGKSEEEATYATN